MQNLGKKHNYDGNKREDFIFFKTDPRCAPPSRNPSLASGMPVFLFWCYDELINPL